MKGVQLLSLEQISKEHRLVKNIKILSFSPALVVISSKEFSMLFLVASSFNNTFIGFNVRYYVDNIRLEHWRRPWRVESELTKDVMRRFKIEGVKLPKAMYRSGDENTQAGVFIT